MRNPCKHTEPRQLTNHEYRWWWCQECGATKLDIGHGIMVNDGGWYWSYRKGKWKSPNSIKDAPEDM